MRTVLQLNNVTKQFTKEKVINNISFEVEEGKIVGLVGKKGLGKSVLFKIICGLLKPTLGEVIVFDENITKNKTFPKNTRAIIEKPCFLEYKSGFKNLEYLAKLTGTFNKQRIENALSLVNLEKKDWYKKVKNYSMEMKQKLAFAQVIMDNPKLVILDEPFNSLKEDSVVLFKKIIKDLKLNGVTILLATHFKEDIEELCDVLYEIKYGKLSLIE